MLLSKLGARKKYHWKITILNHARNNNWGFAEILADVYKTGIPFHAYETPVGLVHGEN
jgi:hypothetical protein